MTFDVSPNSLCFTRKYKAIWKENLAVYHKSLKAFFPGNTLNETINQSDIESLM